MPPGDAVRGRGVIAAARLYDDHVAQLLRVLR
jgi:hypothetical protein